jgi:hypothetical protein
VSSNHPSNGPDGPEDRTEILLAIAAILFGLLLLLPLVLVAVPVWLMWRLLTRGRFPAWLPLAVLAAVVLVGGAGLALTGHQVASSVTGYLTAQRAAGDALLDLLLVPVVHQQPVDQAGLSEFARGYAGRIWPYGVMGGPLLAAGLELWWRLRQRGGRAPVSNDQESQPRPGDGLPRAHARDGNSSGVPRPRHA